MNTVQGAKRHISAAKKMLELLGIDGVTLTIREDRKLISKFTLPDVDVKSVLIPSEGIRKAYTLIIDKYQCANVVCHEMIHLAQYESGRLRKDGDIMIWEGKTYDNSVPYEQRPWEIEAFAKQKELYKAYRYGRKQQA